MPALTDQSKKHALAESHRINNKDDDAEGDVKLRGPASLSETVQLLRRLLSPTLRKHQKGFLIAITGMIAVAATTTASAWIIRDVVNHIFIERDKQMLWIISGLVLIIFIVKGLAAYFSSLAMTKIGNAIVAENRLRLFDKVMSLGFDYHLKTGFARKVNHVTRLASASRTVTDLVITSLVRDLLTLAGLVFVMFAQKPLLCLVALMTAPLAILGTARLSSGVRAFADDELKAEAGVIKVVQEASGGIRDVKSFRLEGMMRERAREATEWARFRADFIARVIALTTPLMETLGGFAIAGVMLYGGWMAIEAGEAPGSFMAFITALLLAYEPAKRLARLRVTLASRMVAIRRMFNILDMEPSVSDSPDATPLVIDGGEVGFTDVKFQYPGTKEPLFNEMNLRIPGRQLTAIIGPSGSGKSSLVNLLLRFFDPAKGQVLIDGHNIADHTTASLRDAVSYVSQDIFLFDGSIAENIRIGRQDASDEEIAEAAHDAGASKFIDTLPDGYKTLIGENGIKLSGGQRQRLALARAFLKQAPILVLDEATSALDSRTEKTVMTAIKKRIARTTVILITHRLAIVRQADQIHVMDNGDTIETGSHEALMQTGGLYSRLFALHELGFDPTLSQ